jgi:hypothetical protein
MVWCERIESPRVNAIGTYGHFMRGTCKCGATHGGYEPLPTLRWAETSTATPRRRSPGVTSGDNPLAGAVRTIDYLIKNAGGDHIATHRRFEFADKPKTFRWFLPNGRMGLGGLSSRQLPMYGSELLQGIPRDGSVSVIVVEGEKAAESLRARGYTVLSATTGAPQLPGTEALAVLQGLQVVQWPDNDPVGVQQADAYVRALQGVAAGVWRLDVSSMPEHGDAADWTGTDEDLAAFIYSATKVEAPLVEEDAPAAVEAAGEIFDADRRRRKALRDRYSTGMVMTELEDLVRRGAAINECMERWIPAICGGCGAKPAFMATCHDANCPLCAPGRMKHDWQIMIDRLPELKAERFAMVRWIPDAPVTGPKALKDARNRFTEGRKRLRLEAGIVGNRTSRQHGAVILTAFPSSVAVPARCGSFTAEIVRQDAGERDVATWLWQEYEDEIAEACEASEAGDAAFYLAWLAATKGRKRFSAFGKLWSTPTWSPEDDRTVNGGAEDAVPVSIAGFTGGSGHAGEHEKRKCPFCGSTRLTKYAFKVASDRLTNERGHTEWVPLDR